MNLARLKAGRGGRAHGRAQGARARLGRVVVAVVGGGDCL